jgi:hypothetical protein
MTDTQENREAFDKINPGDTVDYDRGYPDHEDWQTCVVIQKYTTKDLFYETREELSLTVRTPRGEIADIVYWINHTPKTVKPKKPKKPTYKEKLEWIWKNCKVVYWPKTPGVYPIEHVVGVPQGGFSTRFLIEAEMLKELDIEVRT